jgi:O-antigen/teichoic acid export membrane protein
MPGKTKAAVVIMWIGAVLGLVLGLVFLVSIGPVADGRGIYTFLIVVVIATAALNAAFAIAIQKRRNWARITTIVLCSIGAAVQALSVLSGDASGVVGLGLNAVIIVLLASADSKEWCRG